MKRMIAVCLALLLVLLCTVSPAESTLTHFVGRCGFTMDYPEELLDVFAYATNTTFAAKAEEDIMSLTVLAEPELSEDPVGTLVTSMEEYRMSVTREDVRTLKTDAGTDIYTCTIDLEEAFMEMFILQEDGRQFYFDIYMHNDVRDKYLDAAEKAVLSFVTDPDGDFSGYEESYDEEGDIEADYYSFMIDQYAPALQLWGTAAWEKWDPTLLDDCDISILLALMDHRADQVLVDFADLDNDGDAEMLLYTAPADGSEGANLLEIYYHDENDAINPDLISAERDAYSLCGDAENGYIVREDASDSAFRSGVFFWQMAGKGAWDLVDGVIFQADDAGNPGWYRTQDLDWDIANDEAITEEQAMEILDGTKPCNELITAFCLADYMALDMDLPLETAE